MGYVPEKLLSLNLIPDDSLWRGKTFKSFRQLFHPIYCQVYVTLGATGSIIPCTSEMIRQRVEEVQRRTKARETIENIR